MSTLKSLAGNVLLLFISIIVAVLIGEFLVRFLYPQRTLFPRYVASLEYKIALPPNAELVHSQGGNWKFIYHTNELGLRGSYLPIAKTNDDTKVVVLGDSFAFGTGVNDSEVFSLVMSEELGNDFYVLNGGMGGWGIDSEIKWYFKTGQAYTPSYVVLQFTANDPGDSFTGVTKIENRGFAFYPYPIIKPAWQKFLSRSSIIQKSHLYSALRKVWDGYVEDISGGEASDSVGDDNKIQQENYVEMLRLFAELLQAQGVQLLFVSVTHWHGDNYHYDLEHFPMIKKEIGRLGAEGLLSFVDLPLEPMSSFRGSPEGHQWAAAHHAFVGKAIALKILNP